MMMPLFSAFAPPVRKATPLRQAITAAYRRGEPESLAPLITQATFDLPLRAKIHETARILVEALRANKRQGVVEGLVREYALSSHEGIALMCLAEALLRIPDIPTRDALIRDKLAIGDWRSHLGGGKSLFVNAATWGLVITGKLVGSIDDKSLGAALTRLVARAGEPLIRVGVDMAMGLLGEQFVAGETIEDALKHAGKMEAKGFRYSYDMLGEAALTAADAERYYADYEKAIHSIGKAAAGKGVIGGPGISIKLSALHPRYSRAQADRVMAELFPRLQRLAALARDYNIGLNIDAEEQDRLELSLDILESLAFDPKLEGWNGLGFVTQAYGKRCPFVLDWTIDLARRANRRIMVRLVKGAYWDAEIKRAQTDGLLDFPVYTRKHHTDIAYVACARKLLAARDAIFPQFATHNAQTLSTIHHLAGPDFDVNSYEFQCLHGMGEGLYEHVVDPDKLARPCRIYAPVGTHDTLLAYLVRRLLENGANSSFVNRIGDEAVPVEELVADPVQIALRNGTPGLRHELIALPAELHPNRRNSIGIDLSDETALAHLDVMLRTCAHHEWRAASVGERSIAHPIRNPGDLADIVGVAYPASPEQVIVAAKRAAGSCWPRMPVIDRAETLDKAANAMQKRMPELLGLIMREAGKSMPNAIAEVREAIDFLRYYAQQSRTTLSHKQQPLGPVACISPWNFPLAIFTGQVAAALAAGNSVLAKPAEETPLIAAQAVRLLHDAGVPSDALQLLPGDGAIGAALVAAPETAAVLFTGSTEVARLIQRQLADRLSPAGKPIPLIAETGGQNAMIVDSSALVEQVVVDVIASAFDSAGQRCSALRLLCLQEEVADRMLSMLRGALRELRIGRTDRLSIDIGPIISDQAKVNIDRHIDEMRQRGRRVDQHPLPEEATKGTFVPPTIIEIADIADLKREIFGPVLHVIRYRRKDLDRLIDAINATGYGLTFGLHSRLDAVIGHVVSRVGAGNIYVNRNMIGATVGVQPFGGRGLSGTGPKAGGPLYLGRLVTHPPVWAPASNKEFPEALTLFIEWLNDLGEYQAAAVARRYGVLSALGIEMEMPGPEGERNLYMLKPRGSILLQPATTVGLYDQMAAVLASGNSAVVESMPLPDSLPDIVTSRFSPDSGDVFAAALVEGNAESVTAMLSRVASRQGAIVSVHAVALGERGGYPLDFLLEEVLICTNTAAAGGNARLMSIF
jgi:RHH-type proline utilization regulon transcriptional repressor/proline dehydrogenase/delta 1-pyrroline-5-carboxylate dehydrogenase